MDVISDLGRPEICSETPAVVRSLYRLGFSPEGTLPETAARGVHDAD